MFYVKYPQLDINECDGNTTGCSQGCDNKRGGFRCFCWKGYALHVDNKTCVGMLFK